MKKKFTLLSFLIAISIFSYGQNCQQVFFDDYSDPSLWTHIGPTTNVSVTGGVCLFNDAWCDHYDKILRQMPFTLSNTYWKAELKFSITAPNAFGNGTGAVLFAATADTLDMLSYDADSAYALTDQDGICISLNSVAINDDNINNWRFTIYSKKGNTTPSISTGLIYANSTISTYYLRLERFAIDSLRLGIFIDTAFSVPLPNSPIVTSIDPAITGLYYVQQGVHTWGYNTRHLTGIIDSLYICNSGTTGITETQSQQSVFMYPNPADKILHLSPFSLPATIRIFNTLGQQVYESSERINQGIDISSFSNGIYFLCAESIVGIMESKFIVQH